MDLEEKQRQAEIKQNEDLERKIAQAERERQQEEVLSRTRASELKKLQEEEKKQRMMPVKAKAELHQMRLNRLRRFEAKQAKK